MLNKFGDACVKIGAVFASCGWKQGGQGESDGYSGGVLLGTSGSDSSGVFSLSKVLSNAMETQEGAWAALSGVSW